MTCPRCGRPQPPPDSPGAPAHGRDPLLRALRPRPRRRPVGGAAPRRAAAPRAPRAAPSVRGPAALPRRPALEPPDLDARAAAGRRRGPAPGHAAPRAGGRPAGHRRAPRPPRDDDRGARRHRRARRGVALRPARRQPQRGALVGAAGLLRRAGHARRAARARDGARHRRAVPALAAARARAIAATISGTRPARRDLGGGARAASCPARTSPSPGRRSPRSSTPPRVVPPTSGPRPSRPVRPWWVAWAASVVLGVLAVLRGLGGSTQALADAVLLHALADIAAAVAALADGPGRHRTSPSCSPPSCARRDGRRCCRSGLSGLGSSAGASAAADGRVAAGGGRRGGVGDRGRVTSRGRRSPRRGRGCRRPGARCAAAWSSRRPPRPAP